MKRVTVRTIPGKSNYLDKKSQLMQDKYREISKRANMPSMGRYNITVSHQSKFIWFRVAKVGTRTILAHLKESGIPLDVVHGNELHYPVNIFEDYFKFAFVRNPWDRLASCWRDKVVNNNYFQFETDVYEDMKQFEKFVDYVSGLDIERCDRHLCSQSALIDLNTLDYLGRMETFRSDTIDIFDKIGMTIGELGKKNVTSIEKKYQDYYNEVLAEKVSQIYRKDIQLFGYEF